MERTISDIEKAYYTLHLHLLKDSRIKKIEVNKVFAEKLQTENYKITKLFCDVNEMTIFGFPIKMKDMIDLYRIYDKNGNLLHRGILAKDQKIIDTMNKLTKIIEDKE